ncbi:MAG: sugar ABC transporter permease [Roseiflexaceae bacterium]|nr:sugar ABC transporter permease [Roseiflexaceae bacterium]
MLQQEANTAQIGQVARVRPRFGPQARHEERMFYLFISPWLIGFILFWAGPIIASFVLSFTNWNLLGDPQWVGFANYTKMSTDKFFAIALVNTLYYGIGSVILGVAVAFMLALLLNQKVYGQAMFRTVFYLPSVVSGIAVALLWLNIFNPDFGLLNQLLRNLGVENPPGWLVSPQWAMPALIIMSVWGAGGSMVIYLAGLQSIPEHLYEAAAIDGAGRWTKFWVITVPMMSPVIFFNLITGFIGSLQAFVQILVMTDGGPANATLVYGLYLYRNAFRLFQMGYASALSWALFIVIITITVIQFALAKRWVYYEGEVPGRTS